MTEGSLLLERVKDDVRRDNEAKMEGGGFDHTDNWSDSWTDGAEHADSGG